MDVSPVDQSQLDGAARAKLQCAYVILQEVQRRQMVSNTSCDSFFAAWYKTKKGKCAVLISHDKIWLM